MKKLDILALLLVPQNAGFLLGTATIMTDRDTATVSADPEAMKKIGERLSQIEAHCVELGLTASAVSTRRLLELEQASGTPFKKLSEAWNELSGRLNDELSASLLMFIEPDKAHLYTKPDLFGPEVTDKFPSAIQDIEEAGKCLATGRNTAAVFHAMRALEIGLRTLGRSLNDPSLDPDKNPTWERILGRGDRELNAKQVADRSPEWRAKPEFFAEAIANLRAVKTAWRNPTMHVRGVYDEERALDIFGAVRGFMRHLATELRE